MKIKPISKLKTQLKKNYIEQKYWGLYGLCIKRFYKYRLIFA